MTPLNPKRVIVGALASVIAELPALAKALLGPGIVYLGLNFLPITEPTAGAVLLLGLASLILHTIFAITTHRIILLGPGSIPEWGLRRWSMRETRFAGYVLLLGLMLGVLAVLAMATQPVGPFIVMIAAIVGGSALSLIFPAIALEQPLTLQDAWRKARGNLPALILCVWLFPFTLAMLTLLIGTVPYARPIAALLELVATVLTIAVLSVAFTEINRES